MQSVSDAGYAWITVKRAKKALGARSANHGRNGSLWLQAPNSEGEKTHDP
jgi:hypothetical protein